MDCEKEVNSNQKKEKMRKIFFSGVIVLMISSCASFNQFLVTPIGEEPIDYKERFIYSLPRTVLEVKVEFEKNIYLPGPYRNFTERYLGMSEFIDESKTEWHITGVKVSEFSEPDPLHYYSVNIMKGTFQKEDYFSISSEGIIIDPMGAISYDSQIPGKTQTRVPSIIDLNLKKNHREISDTLFKTVIKDSSFVKIPILRKQREAKTLEQKAEEAANLIIKIRKRRLKLMTGEYNVFPEGKALKISLAELNKIENEYLALFIGKVHTEKYSRSYIVIPEGISEKTEILKFSETAGILSKDAVEGLPLTIEFSPEAKFFVGDVKQEGNEKNTLFYRIPSIVSVTVSDGNNLIYEGRISIFQAGSVVPLPAKKSRL